MPRPHSPPQLWLKYLHKKFRTSPGRQTFGEIFKTSFFQISCSILLPSEFMLAFLAFFEPPDYQSFPLGLFLGAKCCGVAFLFFGVCFKHSPPLAAVQNTSVITVCPTVASSMFLSCRLALSCLCLGHVHVSPQYMNRSVIPICIPCCWRGLSAGADKFWTAILMPVLIFSLS